MSRSAAGATNEDAALADDALAVYAVSDGVGSCADAARASRLAIDAAVAALRGGLDVRGAMRAAQARLEEDGRFLAATLTILRGTEGGFWVGHVGDSRAYLVRDERLSQITRDHSIAFEQYLAGAISKDDIARHPNQKRLTRALGGRGGVPDLADGSLRPGDRFLLCTDGLTSAVREERLLAILRAEAAPEDACARLVDAAAGADDDVTALVVDVSEGNVSGQRGSKE